MTQISKFNSLGLEAKLHLKNILNQHIPQTISPQHPIYQYLKQHGLKLSEVLDQMLLNKLDNPLPTLVLIDQVKPELQLALSQLHSKPNLIQIKDYQTDQGQHQIHTYHVPINAKLTAAPEPDTQTNVDSYYDFTIQNITNTLTATSDTTYIYQDTRTYLPQKSYSHPIKFFIRSYNEETTFKIIEAQSYQPTQASQNTGWHTRIELETTFPALIKKQMPLPASIKLEVKSPNFPPHLTISPFYPVEQDITFQLDLSRTTQPPQTAKLLEFISEKASRSITPSSAAPTQDFQNGQLTWKIAHPTVNHVYFLTWQEPCTCQWCKHHITY